MNCPNCNAPNQDGQRFCANCGAPLNVQPRNNMYNAQPNYGNQNYNQQPNPYNNGYGMPPNHNMYNSPKKPPFYCRTWFLVLTCIFVPFVGLIFLWISKRPRNLAARIILSVFLAFVIIIQAIMTFPDDRSKSSKTVSTTDSVRTDKDVKKESDIAKDDPEKITVGSTFEVNDLKITVNEANTDFTDFDNSYGSYDLPEGMKYIMVSFTFENVGNDGTKYVSIYDFDCYADNATCDQAYLPDDSDFMNTNLSPGRNISFKTYYEVPQNANSIELEYHESMLGDGRTKIVIQ